MSDINSDSVYVQIKSPCEKRFPSPLSCSHAIYTVKSVVNEYRPTGSWVYREFVCVGCKQGLRQAKPLWIIFETHGQVDSVRSSVYWLGVSAMCLCAFWCDDFSYFLPLLVMSDKAVSCHRRPT